MRKKQTQYTQRVNVWTLFTDNLNGYHSLALLQNDVNPTLANLYRDPQVPVNVIWYKNEYRLRCG